MIGARKAAAKSPLSSQTVMKILLHLRRLCNQYMKHLKIHTTIRTTITRTNSNSRINIKLRITSKTIYDYNLIKMFRACASIFDSLFSCGSTVYGKDDEAFANEQARLIKDTIETYPPIIIETL